MRIRVLLRRPCDAEALKAKSPRDDRTLDLFGGDVPSPSSTPSSAHGGHLHPEQRTDRTGRTETRWVSTPAPAPAQATPGEVQVGQRVEAQRAVVTAPAEAETFSVKQARGLAYQETGTTASEWEPAEIVGFAEDGGPIFNVPDGYEHTDTQWSRGGSGDGGGNCALCGTKIKNVCRLVHHGHRKVMGVGTTCIEKHAEAVMPGATEADLRRLTLRLKPEEVAPTNGLIRAGIGVDAAVARTRAALRAVRAFDKKYPRPGEADVARFERVRPRILALAQSKARGERLDRVGYDYLTHWRTRENVPDWARSDVPLLEAWTRARLAAAHEAERKAAVEYDPIVVKAAEVREALRARNGRQKAAQEAWAVQNPPPVYEAPEYRAWVDAHQAARNTGEPPLPPDLQAWLDQHFDALPRHRRVTETRDRFNYRHEEVIGPERAELRAQRVIEERADVLKKAKDQPPPGGYAQVVEHAEALKSFEVRGERPQAAPGRSPVLGPPPKNNRQKHPFVGTIDVPGLPQIRIETAAGEWRRGTDQDGKPWAVKMPAHYGEIAGVAGADGDPLDVYVGQNLHAPDVYVVHINDPTTGEYDEDKVFVGFDNKADVARAFAKAYTRRGFRGGMRRLTFPEFLAWIEAKRRDGTMITAGEVLKGGAIAGGAGLHLDPVRHRWVRDLPIGERMRVISGAIRESLTPELLKPEYRKRVEGGADPCTGHCYAASEALYHLAGGKDAGLKPMSIQHEGGPHWWIAGDGQHHDITSAQFSTPVPYHQGTGKGFLTKEPSKRAQTLMSRALQRLDRGEALKAGPIANRAGLVFDNMARRWKKADGSEQGVHLDPETKRARAVRRPEPEGVSDVIKKITAADFIQHQKRAVEVNRTLEHFEGGNLEFKHAKQAGRHAVVIPDASEPGRWRYSEYDERGFAGHRTFDTPHEAAAAAAIEGFTEPAPGSLDRLSATPEWADGTRRAKMVQTANELGFAGHHDAARAASDHFFRHGASEEALQRVHRPDVLAGLRRGEVHPELFKAAADDEAGFALAVIESLKADPPASASSTIPASLRWEA